MFEKTKVKEITSKGQIEKNISQYLRVAFLPEVNDEEYYPKKWSLEIGKILEDGTYSRPTSFRSVSPTQIIILIKALVECYKLMEKDTQYLSSVLRKVI